MSYKKGGLTDLLGWRLEHAIQCAFSGLEPLDDHDTLEIYPGGSIHKNNPDFIIPHPNGDGLLEVKTAYGGHDYYPHSGKIELELNSKAYGAQIKGKQVDAFGRHESEGVPVLYAIGFHGVFRSTSRIAQIKGYLNRHRFIRNNFISPSVFLISNDVITHFFEKEKKLSAKAQELTAAGKEIPDEVPGWFASLKPPSIRQLTEAVANPDEPLYIDRGPNKEEIFDWYGLNPLDLISAPLGHRQTKFTFQTKKGPVPIQIGYVVNKKSEYLVQDLLSRYTVSNGS